MQKKENSTSSLSYKKDLVAIILASLGGISIEIFTDEDKIILKKYQPACIFCGNADNITYFKGKLICNHCLEELKNE